MRKLATLTAVSALALGLAAGTAEAGPNEKGIFEAPMVPVNGACDLVYGGECDDSEGKVERNGDWKVEIQGVTPDEDYEVCLHDAGGFQWLAEVTSDEDGELKATELSLGAAHVAIGTYQRPRLVVRLDRGGDCDGPHQYDSGFALP
jgi:hypothetical protein